MPEFGPLPLRIALMTHSVLPRGGVVHVLELADALSAGGHAVTVIAPAEPGQQLFRATAARVALIALPRITGDLVQQVGQRINGLSRGLPAVLQAGRFDLVHAHDSLSGNALANVAEAGIAIPPWVRTIHHLDDFTQPQLAAWQARAWRSASALACVSDTWVQRLQSEHGMTARRMFNGVNLARFQPVLSADDAALLHALGFSDPDRQVCLALGGIETRKNTLRVLEAFARLHRGDPRWQLVVAGGASLLDHHDAHDAWNARLLALGLSSPDVVHLGPVPDAAVPALMRRATVLASPSLMEGFGLVALEALACGTPVLVSQRAPYTEHLGGCAHVAWCDPESVASIAAGLQEAAALPRASKAPAVCIDHGWDRSARHHEDWYRSVLLAHQPQAEALAC